MKKVIRFISFLLILVIETMLVLAAPKLVYLDVGDTITVDGRKITLQNVGEGGSILIDVDGTRETISSGSTKTINGIEISNDDTFYTNEMSERSAIISVSFTEVNELCSNGILDSATEEENIDCGGYCNVCETCYDGIKNQDETDIDCGGNICQTCNAGMTCKEDEDCLDNNCYKKECIKCKKFIEPECPNGKLISKGKENGCNLGYICCGDSYCSEWENENNCLVDCKIQNIIYVEKKEVCSDKDKDGFLGGDCLEDCNDNDPSINKYALEILDGKDNNCDKKIDEGLEKQSIKPNVIEENKEPKKESGFFNKIFSSLFSFL